MKRAWKLFAVAILAVPVFAGNVFAQPTLQLDILDGVYDPVTETIVATDDSFTLYALLIPDQDTTLADTFYISTALVPKVGPADASLGSFTFNSTTVNATADMVYGVPPLEANLAQDPGDLSQHGIFETFFREFAFTFSAANTAEKYNSADDAGQGPTPSATGEMYFEDFLVNVANLDSDYRIHFDLYTKEAVNGELDVSEFAPFSHDAESGPGNGNGNGNGNGHQVPEPGTLAMLGTSLFLLSAARKARKDGI